jgi:hypothetical protein
MKKYLINDEAIKPKDLQRKLYRRGRDGKEDGGVEVTRKKREIPERA